MNEEAIVFVLLLIIIWKKGCCIKKMFSGILCKQCSKCTCKECSRCHKRIICIKCPDKHGSDTCKCSPCMRHAADVREAFVEADRRNSTEGIKKGNTKVEVTKDVKTPEVKTEKSVTGSVVKNVTKVQLPTDKPKCDCPKCHSLSYGLGLDGAYSPIYRPAAYGMRY